MEEQTELKLQCVFCFSDQFVFPSEDYQPKHGELMECANCGRQNDYDSLIRVVHRKANEWIESQTKSLLKDLSKEFGKIIK